MRAYFSFECLSPFFLCALLACGDQDAPTTSNGSAHDADPGAELPATRTSDAANGEWLRADVEWPMPPPLLGVTDYQLPVDEAEWIARSIQKLLRGHSIDSIRYAKEMLAEMGPAAISALGQEIVACRGGQDTQTLSSILHLVSALAYHPAADTWPVLLPLLDHPSPMVRRETMRGLVGCKAAAVAENLAARLRQRPSLGRARVLTDQILGGIGMAVQGIEGTATALARRMYQSAEARVYHVDAGDDELRRYLDVLIGTGQPIAIEALMHLAGDLERADLHRDLVERVVLLPEREDALRILKRVEADLHLDDGVRPLLLPVLRRALATVGDPDTIKHFERLSKSKNSPDRVVAILGLGCSGDIETPRRALTEDEAAEVRSAGANGLSFALRREHGFFPPDEWPRQGLPGTASSEVLASVKEALADPNPVVREEAARVAALLAVDELFQPLLDQLRSEDSLVRLEALRVLVAPRVQWKPASAVLMEQLDQLEPSARQEWLQAAVLLSTPSDAPALVAVLKREELWGAVPAGEVAARYMGDLGRQVADLFIDVYREANSAALKARAVRCLSAALAGNSETRLPDPPRYQRELSNGARFLVQEALDDPDLDPELRFFLLSTAPRYGGAAIAPLLAARFHTVPLPPRERAWLLRILTEYF